VRERGSVSARPNVGVGEDILTVDSHYGELLLREGEKARERESERVREQESEGGGGGGGGCICVWGRGGERGRDHW